MPVEVFSIADSTLADWNGGHTGKRVRRELLATSPVTICQGIRDALLTAGWEFIGAAKANGSLVMPGGLPIESGIVVSPKPTIDSGIHICTIRGTGMTKRIMFYDAGRHTPNTGIEDITWLAMGETFEDSLDALEGAIATEGWTVLTAWQQPSGTFGGWWHLDFEAGEGGLEWNDETFGGWHLFDAASNAPGFIQSVWPYYAPNDPAAKPNNSGPAGGGLILRSTQGEAPDETWLQVYIYVNPFTPHSATFTFEGSTAGINMPTFQLGTGANYVILANQFQFFVARPNADPLSAAGKQQLLCIFPWMNADKGVDYAAVLSGVGAWRTRASWDASNTCAAVNGQFSRWLGSSGTGEPAGTLPGIYPFRFRYELYDPSGKHPVAGNAYLGAPINGADKTLSADFYQARIVGRIWDAFVMQSNDYALDEIATFGGMFMQCVLKESRTDATPCSLWVAFDPQS